ncbi:MAG: hypothetical protein FWG98_08670 [Candidatus Cloacimonetes bacterium]|nr:hypothetical protein [Candidatus Cloacimonadota bacterium]
MRQEILDKLFLMFENELDHHPSSRLVDLFKLYMQSAFGPGHLIKDKDNARAYLTNELFSYQQYLSTFDIKSKNQYLLNLKKDFKMYNSEAQNVTVSTTQSKFSSIYLPLPPSKREKIKQSKNISEKEFSHSTVSCPCLILDCDIWLPLARYSTQLIADNIIPFDDYFEAFLETSNEISEKINFFENQDETIYIKYWNAVIPFLAEKKIDFFFLDQAMIENHISEKQYLIRHSYTYNIKYKPSYRIINKSFLTNYDKMIKERYFLN